MERGAREFMKSLISIHDTECQIISFHVSNADAAEKGSITENRREKGNIVPKRSDIAFTLFFTVCGRRNANFSFKNV